MLLKPRSEEQNESGMRYDLPAGSRLRILSPVVWSAQRYLQSAMGQKPFPYQSRYETQISGLYDQIMNRPAFSYDASRDPLFQQYRNQYIRDGQRAMQDSIGASAALTGGYGNSWAATAGYQAYGQYLKALNDKLPELQKQAREAYDAEGKALTDKANLTLNLDNREYGWYRDAMNDWQFDAKLALEQQKFDFQVQKYRDALLASAGIPNISMMEEEDARLRQQIMERKMQTGR
ncbi:MAG: hypothetical protein IJT77_04825 [Clostridia bacterium]|nr:hypothetical protein [Clostridia bacterium]